MITLLNNFPFDDLNPTQMVIRPKVNLVDSINELELSINNEENQYIIIKPHK